MTRIQLVAHDVTGLLLMTVAAIALLWALEVIQDARDETTPFRVKDWPPPFCWTFAAFLGVSVAGMYGLASVRVLVSDKPVPWWGLLVAMVFAGPPFVSFLIWSGVSEEAGDDHS